MQKNRSIYSNSLKFAVFATGLAGIVAEYVLATLATYFIGNALVQWALVVSIMLFAMGLGSRFSKYIKGNLMVWFLGIEFTLSVLVGFSALFSYAIAGFTEYLSLIIYSQSIAVGLLIGMEIPLVVRLNESFEALHVNISNVLEKDYYGSLLGGLFFSFVGLPYLGLTYTPFVLGLVNLLVALVLLWALRKILSQKLFWSLNITAIIVTGILFLGAVNAPAVITFGEQKQYKDKVVLSKQTAYQHLVVTQWRNDYWLFINGNQQFSTFDEAMYHEPLIHPVMEMVPQAKNILVLGGGDGCAVREILKHPSVEKITLVDLDEDMVEWAKEEPLFKAINLNALNHSKVQLIYADAFNYLQADSSFYDVIVADLPDPRTHQLARMYSEQFYRLVYLHLKANGAVITQAGSPYFAPTAFACIDSTMAFAGFNTIPLHNQIVTMGEWGWIIGTKGDKLNFDLDFGNIETHWLNNEGWDMMTKFGKPYFSQSQTVEVNTIQNGVLVQYYNNGTWELY